MISPTMMAAMVDEMMKISMAAPSLAKALKSGPFSTSALNRSSIKLRMPNVRTAPPMPTGRVMTVGGSSIATGIPGANIRMPTTRSPNMPLQKIEASVAPASPTYVSPTVNVQAAPTRQGAPQVTQAVPQATGGGSTGSAGSVRAPSPGGLGARQ